MFGKRMLIAPAALNRPAPAGDLNNDGVSDLVSFTLLSMGGQPSVVSIYVSTAKQPPPGPPDIQCATLSAAQCAGPTAF